MAATISSMSEKPLEPVYSIWGEDRAKVDRAIARLVKRARDGGMPPERLAAPEASGREVAAACETLAFGGLRLVIVTAADGWRADDVGPLVDYLATPNPMSCLALVSAGPLTPRLAGAVAGVGQVLQFGPDPKAKGRERSKWFVAHLVAEVKRNGSQIPAPLAREVVAAVGEDSMTLTREAEKLALLAGSEKVTQEMIAALVTVNPEAKSWELSDALAAGETTRVYDVLQDMATGDDPKKAIMVVGALVRQFRALATVQVLAPGASSADAEAATGLRGYPAQKVAEQSRRLPPGAGERAVVRLARLELDLRVSAYARLGRTPDDGERLVLELAARDLLALTRGVAEG